MPVPRSAPYSAHKVVGVLSVLIAVPLTVYLIGVCRTVGAVMMAATAGLQETLYAGLAVRRCRHRSS